MLALPPWDVPMLGGVALIPLLLRAQGLRPMAVFTCFWAAATLGMLGACPWWPETMHGAIGLERGWAWAIATALTAWQTLPCAACVGLCALLRRRRGVSLFWSLPVGIALTEAWVPAVLQFHLGVLLVDYSAWRQWAELGGPPMVSALVVAINLVGCSLIQRRPLREHAWPVIGLCVAAMLGWLRARDVEARRVDAPSMSVALLHANLGRLSAARRDQTAQELCWALRSATDCAIDRGAELVVWPEALWPFCLDRDLRREWPLTHPWAFRTRRDAHLVLGTLTRRAGTGTLYNSAIWISPGGDIHHVRDKSVLVPFAEFLPGEAWLSSLQALRRAHPDWPEITAGGDAALPPTIGRLRAGLLNCAEELDGNVAVAEARKGANLLVAVGSDASFQSDAAARLHLALARFRAVETGRDLVRSVHGGVSAAISASGRILQMEAPGAPSHDGPACRIQQVSAEARLLTHDSLRLAINGWFVGSFAVGLLLLALLRGATDRPDEKHGLGRERNDAPDSAPWRPDPPVSRRWTRRATRCSF